MARADDLHVVPDPDRGGWKLTRARRTLMNSATQERVEAVGRRLARKNKVNLVTHGLDGQIRSKDSYRNESPARDSEH